MFSGLVEKVVRETWAIALIACVALGAVSSVFTSVLPQFEELVNDFVTSMPLVRTMISAMVGVDLSEGVSGNMLLAVQWTHPIVLSIVWGFAIVFSSRMPAGEIELGTIDVLLGWPASRRAIYLSEAFVCMAVGLAVISCGFVGFELSVWAFGVQGAPPPGVLARTLLNFFASYMVVAGITQVFASIGDRRGKVKGFAVGVVLGCYLINFLAQFWQPARWLEPLSFVHYYRPADVMLGQSAPWGDLLVLGSIAAALWTLGAVLWERRSVSPI